MSEQIAFGHTIFCDDIRQEIGGKTSLIGTYAGHMFVNTNFPATLPKFGLVITYSEKLSTFGTQQVYLRVFFPGDPDDKPFFKGLMPMEEMRKEIEFAKYSPPHLPPPEYGYAIMHMLFAPLTIKEEGVIRVQAIRGDETIRLGALRVLKAPQSSS